jgi:hypothetical protein
MSTNTNKHNGSRTGRVVFEGENRPHREVTGAPEPGVDQPDKKKWPLKTLIEILPIIIALTAVFSYSSIRNVTEVDLITPLEEVLGGVPLWVAGLLLMILLTGTLGMGWLMYIFTRAPVAPDGSDEE